MHRREQKTDPSSDDKPLQSWKEIAAYLERSVRTVIRWEKEAGLPVRRHREDRRGSVYAYPSELNAWRLSHQPAEDAQRRAWQSRRVFSVAAAAMLAIVFAAWFIFEGPIFNPTNPLTEAAKVDGEVTIRQVWSGPEVVSIQGSVSPNGRYLSFVDWTTGDLAVRDLKKGKNRRLTNKGSWSESMDYALESRISPDGKHVAYAWSTDDLFYDLRVVGFDGKGLRVLHANPEAPLYYVEPCGWSPDGKRILTTLMHQDRRKQLALISTSDGSVQVIKTFDWQWPAGHLSPDGRYVVYDFQPKEESPNLDIFMIALDGSREVRLVEDPADDYVLGWSPDGKWILFGSDRTGTLDAWAIPVAAGAALGGPQLVKKDIGQVIPLGFSAKGSYYYGVHTGMKDVYVAAFDPAAGKILETPKRAPQHFIGSNGSAEWSPNGRYLAYLSQRGPRVAGKWSDTIVIRDLQTGEERQLLPKLTSLRGLSWSPDSRYLATYGMSLKTRRGFYRIDAETGEVRPMLQEAPGFDIRFPVWSADGKSIIYRETEQSTGVSRIVRRSLEGGPVKEIHQGDGTFVASPDGRQIGFVSWDPDQKTTALINVVSITGGEPRELARVSWCRAIDWTPDGRHLIYGQDPNFGQEPIEEEHHEFWRVAVEGGEPQKLGPAVKGRLSRVRLHPDGKRLALVVNDFSAEVWVMENFLPESQSDD